MSFGFYSNMLGNISPPKKSLKARQYGHINGYKEQNIIFFKNTVEPLIKVQNVESQMCTLMRGSTVLVRLRERIEEKVLMI